DVLTGDLQDGDKPDVIIAVVDATNLERNLYLVTQLFDFDIPVVIALTMVDIFEKQKHQIDTKKLSSLLRAPVIPVIASNKRGREDLAEKVRELAGTSPDVPRELTAADEVGENA